MSGAAQRRPEAENLNYQPGQDHLAEVATHPRARRRAFRIMRIALVAAMLVGVAVWAADWIRTAFLYVHETDARIVSEMVSVSSRVSGWIVEMPATSGLKVGKGDMLARIDGRDAALRLAEFGSERDAVAAERGRIEAEIAMVDQSTESRRESAQAKFAAAEALVQSLQAEAAFAKGEFDRAGKLAKRGVVSARQLDRQRTTYLRAEQNLLRAQADAATASAAVAEAEAGRQQLEVLRRELVRLDHRAAALKARTERQSLDVADRTVASPLNGVVSRTFVAPGQYVIPGQRIALLHDPNDIWVEANIRETEVRRLSVGQKVRIEIDAYPDRVFEGHVTRIGHATTSEFSLLPSSNPSGNFTKITQRLPVRVAVTQVEGLLRPGMMVEVFVDVDGD